MTQYEKPSAFAVKHKDETVIVRSRSGGIFTALSDGILENGGVVYGCILDEQFHVRHARATDKDERNQMRGSKYVQSDMGQCFKDCKKDLDLGKPVMFTGTACQISGLKGFLGKDYENLLCVDIVCHGVPSPRVWADYLNWIQKGRQISSIDFRNKKKYGWANHVMTIYFDNNEEVDDRTFIKLFGKCYIERPSCFRCPYKNVSRPGDITIADYWGVENAAPEFNDNKGTSLVLINNDKGQRYFELVSRELRYKQTDLKDSMQPALTAPFPKPADREQFWRDYQNKGFDFIEKKYARDKLTDRVKGKIKRMLGQ